MSRVDLRMRKRRLTGSDMKPNKGLCLIGGSASPLSPEGGEPGGEPTAEASVRRSVALPRASTEVGSPVASVELLSAEPPSADRPLRVTFRRGALHREPLPRAVGATVRAGGPSSRAVVHSDSAGAASPIEGDITPAERRAVAARSRISRATSNWRPGNVLAMRRSCT